MQRFYYLHKESLHCLFTKVLRIEKQINDINILKYHYLYKISNIETKEDLQAYLNDGWVLGMSTRNKCMVTVYNPLKPSERCFSISKDDPRFLSGELKLASFRKYDMGLGGPCKGLKYINKDGIIKRVKSEELQSYLSDGWNLGMRKQNN